MVIEALAALAQLTRLRIYRQLVQAGTGGRVVTEIGAAASCAPATLSFHLKALAQAKLIVANQEGRFVRYTADFQAMRLVLGYLTENCCAGEAACLPDLPQCETSRD